MIKKSLLLTHKPVITIRLSAPLSERIDSRGEIAVQGYNILECLEDITNKFPQFERILWEESDQLNPAILVFYKEKIIKNNELNHAVADGDLIDIIPAISGG